MSEPDCFVCQKHRRAHLHYHVVPRYPGTPREYWGLRMDEWPEAPKGDEQAITRLCGRLRTYLQRAEL